MPSCTSRVRHAVRILHKRKPTDKLRLAGGQVECQRGSPVVRNDECRRDFSFIDKRIEILHMIGEPIVDVWFSRLAEPDEVRCDAMRRRRNQRNDIAPNVR